jgi:hypothetical protein
MTWGAVTAQAASGMTKRVIDGGRFGQNDSGQTTDDLYQPLYAAKPRLVAMVLAMPPMATTLDAFE